MNSNRKMNLENALLARIDVPVMVCYLNDSMENKDGEGGYGHGYGWGSSKDQRGRGKCGGKKN